MRSAFKLTLHILVVGLTLCLALALAACGSSKASGYKTHSPGNLPGGLEDATMKPAQVRAQVSAQHVIYRDGAIELEGFAAFDANSTARRPAVLVVHDWMGIGEHTRDVCVALAHMGYFAFAADIYGKGIRPTDPESAGKLATQYKNDSGLMRRRVQAGVDFLRAQPLVSSQIAATGYCFGGTAVLELARSGSGVLGVVSFHGGLSTPMPAKPGSVHAKVLVLHGAKDPSVPPEQVKAFTDEMDAAGADWQMVHYANAVHAFTNPRANSKGRAEYNALADQRSWRAMTTFLEELFGR